MPPKHSGKKLQQDGVQQEDGVQNEGVQHESGAKTSMLKLEHEASKLVLGHLVSMQKNCRV